ncbi:MAG TPA: hypothetical protein VFC19_41640 [Candidatus Limnocylindrales bacterium]|nr:hypothetical protein [Candidatus Limnocylindrales bacterium]
MPITELLITGYDGEEPVVAVNLAPDTAAVALTGKGDKGDTVVDSAWEQSSNAFAAIHELIDDLERIQCDRRRH